MRTSVTIILHFQINITRNIFADELPYAFVANVPSTSLQVIRCVWTPRRFSVLLCNLKALNYNLKINKTL